MFNLHDRIGECADPFDLYIYTVTGSHLGLQSEFHLFAANIRQSAGSSKALRRSKPKPVVKYIWSKSIPFYPRAMLLADDALLIAGPEDINDFDAKAPQGDVWMWAVSTEDGEKKAERKLKASPVYDSFAVSGGRLYFTTVDGRVVSYTGQ